MRVVTDPAPEAAAKSSTPALRLSVLTRAQWGAVAPNTAHLSKRTDRIVGVTFHHTTGANLGSEATAEWARNIQRFCMADRGYGDIEYDAMLRVYFDPHDGKPRGVFVEGRSRTYVGAHAKSTGNVANRTTVGVALMGDSRDVFAHPELAPTVKALVELTWYLCALSHAAEHVPGKLLHYGHRDWETHGGTPTYCPGDPLENLVASVLR